MSNIGIMDPAFFVGKNILLNWLNETFEANITKIEQMCTGSIACQILDSIYPGKVQLHNVNFDAKTEPEYVANFKVLQAVFDSEGIIKYIDVPKLIKGKYMDNLEFTQWLKQYFDKNYSGQPYNAKERRDQARQAYSSKRGHRTPTTTSSTASKPKSLTNTPRVTATNSTASTTAPAKKKAPAAAPAATKRAAGGAGASSHNDAAVSELSSQLEQMKLNSDGLAKERSFYFEKLRRIEILCQEEVENSTSAHDLKKDILAILYETDENQEFQAPAEEGAAEGDGGLLDDAELADTTF